MQRLRLTPRRAAAIILLTAVALAALVLVCSGKGILSAHYNVTATEGRVAYLAALGWEVDAQSEQAQDVVLPRVFDGVFADYNQLQRAQGFDLSAYAGLDCTVYSYRVTNYTGCDDTVLAQLYIYKNRVVAGDIHSTALDGFMHGIVKE